MRLVFIHFECLHKLSDYITDYQKKAETFSVLFDYLQTHLITLRTLLKLSISAPSAHVNKQLKKSRSKNLIKFFKEFNLCRKTKKFIFFMHPHPNAGLCLCIAQWQEREFFAFLKS